MMAWHVNRIAANAITTVFQRSLQEILDFEKHTM